MKFLHFIFLVLLFNSSCECYSQTINNSLNNNYLQNIIEKYYLQNNASVDLSQKPYNANPFIVDSLLNAEFELKKINKKGFLNNTFRNGNMFKYYSTEKKCTVTINPLFNIGMGHASNGSVNLLEDDYGIQFDINVNNKLFISSSVYENNSQFPKYINHYVDSLQVVPGMGWARGAGKSVNYNIPYAHIGYKASNIFYFEIGFDKNFIGNGYRSLLLSDFAYSYPYLKIVSDFGKFKYTNIWAQFTDASGNWNSSNQTGSFSSYPKKYAAFNYLTYTGLKHFQLSAFQSLVWVNRDSLGNQRPQDWGVFIPVIYFNSLNFNNGSPGNSVIGFNANYQWKKKNLLYGQLVIDDFSIDHLFKNGKFSGYLQEKFGWQVGMKCYEPLSIKGAFLQMEYNTVRPYVYNNKNVSINYTHYNESLAHPLGANFREFIFRPSYKTKRWLFEGELLLAKYGSDSLNTNWGQNIHLSDYSAQKGLFSYENYTTQGIKTNLLFFNFSINYLMNPVTNSRVSLTFSNRSQTALGIKNNDNIVMIGFSTNLRNIYKDF
jgi:hypothetical protein